MNCSNCGAALPPKSGICRYCQALNDIDLRSVARIEDSAENAARTCPQCRTALESLNLGAAAPFLVDRCTGCHGLFFDPGELEALIAAHGRPSEEIDLQRLGHIIEEETPPDWHKVKYRKCPVCGEMMNRRSHGARSGVIYDRCADHGIWLDGGELRRILQWVRVGGPQIDAQKKAEQARQDERQRKEARVAAAAGAGLDTSEPENPWSGNLVADAVLLVIRLILRMV